MAKSLIKPEASSRGSRRSPHKAHMTWASRTVSRSASSAGAFLRQQVWVWPIIAVVVLSTLGQFVRVAIERTMKESLTSELETLLGVEVAMLQTWIDGQERNAESLANDRKIRELVEELLDGGRSSVTVGSSASTGDAATAEATDRDALSPAVGSH